MIHPVAWFDFLAMGAIQAFPQTMFTHFTFITGETPRSSTPGSNGKPPKAAKVDSKHLVDGDDMPTGVPIAEANMISFKVDHGSENHPVLRIMPLDAIFIQNLSNGVAS